jgi:hypothetical protein
VPVLTFGMTVSTSDELTPSDTYIPVLTLTPYLQTIAAYVARSVTDTYVPVLTLTNTVRVAGEVDEIRITERPYYIIRIEEV